MMKKEYNNGPAAGQEVNKSTAIDVFASARPAWPMGPQLHVKCSKQWQPQVRHVSTPRLQDLANQIWRQHNPFRILSWHDKCVWHVYLVYLGFMVAGIWQGNFFRIFVQRVPVPSTTIRTLSGQQTSNSGSEHNTRVKKPWEKWYKTLGNSSVSEFVSVRKSFLRELCKIPAQEPHMRSYASVCSKFRFCWGMYSWGSMAKKTASRGHTLTTNQNGN